MLVETHGINFEFEKILGFPCWVAYVHYPNSKVLDRDARLSEDLQLVKALHLKVAGASSYPLKKIRSATLIGQGQLNDLKLQIEQSQSKILFMDAFLTGLQQRNLEKFLNVKVYDRPGFIIEIFAKRAQSAEGRLQVSLAALNYEKTHLVRMWSHLERQRGSLGFIGGPGESQLEMDKRIISEKIQRVEEKLTDVIRTNQLQKKARERSDISTVALIGYTNAGKSTLFNALTDESIFAKDLLFATLETTRRKLRLPSGRQIILSDTVGFISDLPPQLISAFQSTLEETLDADVILHIQDISSSQKGEHKEEVFRIIQKILKKRQDHPPEKIISVYNKIDAVSQEILSSIASMEPDACFISAENKINLDQLLQAIETQLNFNDQKYCMILSPDDGKSLAWLHENGRVIFKAFHENHVQVSVYLSAYAYEYFDKKVRRS